MKLWLVLYVLGVVSTSTEMPDDVTYPECREIGMNAWSAVGSHNPALADTMEFRCVWRDDQPLEGEPAPVRRK